MSQTSKVTISNSFSSRTTLWLEPWGEDYGMSPNDMFEIVAEDVGESFHFHVEFDREPKVYAEGRATKVRVYKDDELLVCGHARSQKST